MAQADCISQRITFHWCPSGSLSHWDAINSMLWVITTLPAPAVWDCGAYGNDKGVWEGLGVVPDAVGLSLRSVYFQGCQLILNYFLKVSYWFLPMRIRFLHILANILWVSLLHLNHSIGCILACCGDVILHVLYYYWWVWVASGKGGTQ